MTLGVGARVGVGDGRPPLGTCTPSSPLREVGGWVSTGWASPRELGRDPGHTIIVGTFDTGITQGHTAGTEGK